MYTVSCGFLRLSHPWSRGTSGRHIKPGWPIRVLRTKSASAALSIAPQPGMARRFVETHRQGQDNSVATSDEVSGLVQRSERLPISAVPSGYGRATYRIAPQCFSLLHARDSQRYAHCQQLNRTMSRALWVMNCLQTGNQQFEGSHTYLSRRQLTAWVPTHMLSQGSGDKDSADVPSKFANICGKVRHTKTCLAESLPKTVVVLTPVDTVRRMEGWQWWVAWWVASEVPGAICSQLSKKLAVAYAEQSIICPNVGPGDGFVAYEVVDPITWLIVSMASNR